MKNVMWIIQAAFLTVLRFAMAEMSFFTQLTIYRCILSMAAMLAETDERSFKLLLKAGIYMMKI
ncbi:MAG: hypothetical protein IJA85_05205 [Clostridia bacterium]|nr:hypothetical protein [Clostridia bacterium]